MSDEISNTAIEATADTVEATAETVSGEKEKNYDLSTKGIKDRIGAAYKKQLMHNQKWLSRRSNL